MPQFRVKIILGCTDARGIFVTDNSTSLIYRIGQKLHTKLMAIILSNLSLTDFKNSFTGRYASYFTGNICKVW